MFGLRGFYTTTWLSSGAVSDRTARALRDLSFHLAEGKMWSDIEAVLCDLCFIRAKGRVLSVNLFYFVLRFVSLCFCLFDV